MLIATASTSSKRPRVPFSTSFDFTFIKVFPTLLPQYPPRTIAVIVNRSCHTACVPKANFVTGDELRTRLLYAPIERGFKRRNVVPLCHRRALSRNEKQYTPETSKRAFF